MGQVDKASALAGKRRAVARWREREAEADWLCLTSGKELVQRGRFWGR